MLACLLVGAGSWLLHRGDTRVMVEWRKASLLPARGATATAAPHPSPTPQAMATPTARATQSAAALVALSPRQIIQLLAAQPRPANQVVATVPPTHTPELTLTPTATRASAPVSYLSRYRLVAFYGSPLGPQLGALGAWPRDTMLQQLRAVASEYQALGPEQEVLPTFHIITTVADPFPGPDGTYSHQLSLELIEEWVIAAEAARAAVVLDIQPGYADIQAEFERIKHLLYLPYVHLALDSEFTMAGGAAPGQTLGYLDGHRLNPIQQQLNEIALEIGVNKVLIVHQFEWHMLRDKDAIEDYPYVELVIDADGFGAPPTKIGDYVQYAQEPGFEYGGFKLFYDWDYPLMSPREVMALDPVPGVIIYQ